MFFFFVFHTPIFLDDEFGEKTVSILLDGEESEMIFIDHPSAEMSVSWMNRHECSFHFG